MAYFVVPVGEGGGVLIEATKASLDKKGVNE